MLLNGREAEERGRAWEEGRKEKKQTWEQRDIRQNRRERATDSQKDEVTIFVQNKLKALSVIHSRLNGHEFEETLGDSEGQGSLACCSPWGRKELDMI